MEDLNLGLTDKQARELANFMERNLHPLGQIVLFTDCSERDKELLALAKKLCLITKSQTLSGLSRRFKDKFSDTS